MHDLKKQPIQIAPAITASAEIAIRNLIDDKYAGCQ
jgi:hypothetical protein